ncbi:hypothetical protein NIES4103_49140 [Nostoc sp. NIES-4103]|nr:hypothetical protein NIES4103_49140 [Nostoc sp. NIES-4103]
MSNTPTASGFWSYVAECVRLLYWTYFKPFTFERWLRDIHPELKPRDNPFAKRAEFRTNPRLRRYAWQVWWLTAVVPVLAVLLVTPIYTLASGKSFNWFVSCVFLVGWLIGRILDRGDNKNRLVIVLAAVLTIVLAIIFLSVLSGVVVAVAVGIVAIGVAIGVMAVGVASGVVSSVVSGVAVGVAVGVGIGVPEDVVGGVPGSVAMGVGFGVTGRVAFGVALGVVGSLVGGLTGNVVVSMAFLLGVLRVYFWLPELLWILILFFFSRIGERVNCLRYLPPRFDEVIILPLPFMDVMIVEAHRNNPTAAHQTINYLINSTNQQKVAARAIYGIASDTLNRCQTLRDIEDIANQLTWIPSPPPKELGTVLPQFLDISQNVKASMEATSPYRQRELLNIPINALHDLKNSLAFGKNALLATRFGSIAERWLTILETARRTLEETAKKSKEIRQVYIAGNSLDPQTAKNRFKGRIDIFREIENLALAEQPPVLLLYGGRKTGKTSALKYLPHKTGSDIIPLFVDIQGVASATTLKGFAENFAQQLQEVARQLPRKIYLPDPNTDKLAEDPFPALQTWFAEIEKTIPNKRFLLCLDEFERLSEVVQATNSRAPLNFIRHLVQHQKQWILLFSGLHLLSELDAYWSDYLINTYAVQMSYLQESEARELILQPVEEFPNIYEPTAVDMIIQLTRCQPYLVQLMCQELVELLNRDMRKNRREADTAKVTVQDVEEVIPTVLERGKQYFQELWTSLADGDRNFLRSLIQGEIPTQQPKGVVRKLVRKGILTPEGNAFQVPLVKKSIEQFLEDE